jgi:hypothetical protein
MPQPTESPTPGSYKVFVSSTFLDNQERRQLVADAITQAGMVWHGMEIFTAETRPIAEVCERYAREADVLVGIIAWRSGSCPPDSEKSYTELEYDAAKKASRPRLMFLLDPDLPVYPNKDYDQGPEQLEKQIKLKKFKDRIAQDQLPASFTETTLQTKVYSALLKWRREIETADGPRAPEAQTAPCATHLMMTKAGRQIG